MAYLQDVRGPDSSNRNWFVVRPCLHWYRINPRRPAVVCERHRPWWAFADKLAHDEQAGDGNELNAHVETYEEVTGCDSCGAFIKAQMWDVDCALCQQVCEAGRSGYRCPICPSQAACGRFQETSANLLQEPVLVDLNFPPSTQSLLREEVEKLLCL